MGSDTLSIHVLQIAFSISIHAPRMGSDVMFDEFPIGKIKISIHAPRMGSDDADIADLIVQYDFNPRSPHGERQRIQR